MAKRDYYEVLGVPKGANAADLKSAFRQKAREFHPDVNNAPDAEEKFKEVNEAFAVLSDDDKRAAYDRFGHEGVNRMGGMPNYSTMDAMDIFEELFGSFGFGGFGGMGGSRSRSRSRAQRGRDLSLRVALEFEEAVHGCEKEIQFNRAENCPVCNGTGAEPGTSPETCPTCHGAGEVRQMRQTILGSMVQVGTCPDCQGSGQIVKTPCKHCNGTKTVQKTVQKTVSIPGGVDTGTQIRITGEGEPGVNGGPQGSLYVEIRVKPHQYFRREGDTIYLDLNLNVAQAALGTRIMVPTVDGEEELAIPAGTQPGKVFTLHGRGVPHLRSTSRGDQKVILNVTIPKHLSKEQRELFEQLSETMDGKVVPAERGFFESLRDFFNG